VLIYTNFERFSYRSVCWSVTLKFCKAVKEPVLAVANAKQFSLAHSPTRSFQVVGGFYCCARVFCLVVLFYFPVFLFVFVCFGLFFEEMLFIIQCLFPY